MTKLQYISASRMGTCRQGGEPRGRSSFHLTAVNPCPPLLRRIRTKRNTRPQATSPRRLHLPRAAASVLTQPPSTASARAPPPPPPGPALPPPPPPPPWPPSGPRRPSSSPRSAAAATSSPPRSRPALSHPRLFSSSQRVVLGTETPLMFVPPGAADSEGDRGRPVRVQVRARSFLPYVTRPYLCNS